jgi:hypothetical protein
MTEVAIRAPAMRSFLAERRAGPFFGSEKAELDRRLAATLEADYAARDRIEGEIRGLYEAQGALEDHATAVWWAAARRIAANNGDTVREWRTPSDDLPLPGGGTAGGAIAKSAFDSLVITPPEPPDGEWRVEDKWAAEGA